MFYTVNGTSVSAGVHITPQRLAVKTAAAGEAPSESSQPTLEEIADGIYQLESSSGKNDQKCERIGLHNGYGYAQWVGNNTCFKSDNEAREQVIKWIENKQKNHTLKELLCVYNTGIKTEDCHYVGLFNSL